MALQQTQAFSDRTQRVKTRPDKENPYPPSYYVGKRGIWSIDVRNQGTVQVMVKIIAARENYGRVDLKIETDTGTSAWVSNQTVEVAKPVRH